MIFPVNFEQKLGFDLIRKMIMDHCLCPLGRKEVERIEFSSDLSFIEKQLIETNEMMQIQLFEENFPSQDYYDLTTELTRIKVEGTYMEPEELANLKLSVISILAVQSFILKRPVTRYPSLTKQAERISVSIAIPKRIEKIIDDRAEVRDDASPTLKKIRRDRVSKQAIVEKKILQTLKTASQSGWTPSDSGVSVRDGRLVIPLLAKYKRQVSGLIHDESATGQTVYMEPAEIVEINNEIKELDFAERREIIHILTEFAQFLRPFHEDLINAYQFLGHIDFLRAKALVAISMRGHLPQERVNTPKIKWREAVHPLLYISHARLKKTVVPLNLSLDENCRILIISGPNAGGKSVCLKTAGLIQYMYQSGILPAVHEDSAFGIFQNIFIDIGDEQSLENDLSTYSSKLLNIKFFIENIDNRSLFLVDEMGTGTDPSLGGPIAEASLEKINEKLAFGVVTTHYSNLKLLAGRYPGIENGAMLYDSKNMKPLFQLQTGLPGSSFAFEIATQIGFPEDVLKNAAEKTGKTQLDFDRQLQDMELEKSELLKKLTEIKVADELLDSLIKKYSKLNEDLEKSKKEIIQKSRDEAQHLLSQSNKIIEKTIKEIKEGQADKERTKAARRELMEFKEKVADGGKVQGSGSRVQGSGVEESNENNPPTSQDHQLTRSPIHQITTSPLHQLKTALEGESPKPTYRGPYQSFYNDLQSKLENFQLTLDLRGKRADETLTLLQRYIDDATLLNIHEVRILHGKGNGVLRQITRDYLRSVKEVKKYQDAPLEAGGSGITVVSFR